MQTWRWAEHPSDPMAWMDQLNLRDTLALVLGPGVRTTDYNGGIE
jgi:hypothetical protein